LRVIRATVVPMRALLVSVVVAAVLAGPAYGEKKPKPSPGDGPKVPWGMCSVIDIFAKSQQHPCPDD
jgi:hypothetical protein